MKIVIDAFRAMLRKTGVGCYVRHLILQLVELDPENNYYLFDSLYGSQLYSMVRMTADLSVVRRFFRTSLIPFPFVTLSRGLLFLQNALSGRNARLEEADIFFGTDYRGIFDKNLKNVITIHDLAHIHFPDSTEKASLSYLKNRLPEVAQKSDFLIAVSEATKKDIVEYLGVSESKLKMIHLGVDESFRPIKDSALKASVRLHYGLPERFILYLGTIEPRKNVGGLIRAYARLCEEKNPEHSLVIAGGTGWKSKGLTALVKNLGVERRVHFTGYVDEGDLPILYNLADLFAFPSLYEGFGLPVLEAMACGVPVVTSNVSSLPEVAGDAAVLVDPHSIDHIADGMRRLLSDNVMRESCTEKGLERAKLFTWEKCAKETIAVFEEVMSSP